jgi:NAD(P)-dependent dehydrogenase (short-subunit alcohol dehydrogenase family)
VDLDLDGKVAVVTGAGKGIGLAVTRAPAEEGAHVVAGSRSTGSLEGLKGVTPVAVDLSGADGPAQLIRRAIEEHGQVDALVNNVGAVRIRTEGFLGTSDEDFAWAMQMNFFIALRASRAAITAQPICGSASMAWRKPWPRLPAWTPTPPARRSSPVSADSPPDASPHPKRSPR